MNDKALTTVDPNVFLAFDRLDDNQIVQELKGAALSEYVYEFTEGGQTVRGLSKAGTDDAARIMAVQYGEALREVDCWLERDDDEAAYFKAKVVRVVTRDDGTQVEMDSAIGHKRQPKGIRLRTGQFRPNNFWYEQGGQKALRNAKQRLMPETIKAAIIKAYVDQGKVRKVRTEEVNTSTGEIVEASGNTAPPKQAPQPSPAQAPPADEPKTDAQRRKLFALMQALDWKEIEIDQASTRQFGTITKNLSKRQASEFIDALEKAISGEEGE